MTEQGEGWKTGHVVRSFEATESPTTLIVVGAVPGKPFEIAAWDK